jgi:hypothetical protein
MKHLVIEQILDCIAGARGTIEDAADDDGVMGSVVMAERALGHMLAPCELRTSEKATEEARIERVEDSFKIVIAAFRAGETLAAASVTDEFGLAGYGGG